METASNISRSVLIIGAAVAFGLLWNYFFFDKMPPGIGFTIYIALIVVAYVFLANYSNRPVRGDLFWIFPLLIFFATMVAIRSSDLLSILNVFACLGLIALVMEVSVQGTMRRFIPIDYFKLFWPLKVVQPLIAVCADILSVRHFTDKKNAQQIVRGILITVPVVAIFGILLANADPVFDKYSSFFTHWNLTEETIGRIIFAVIVTTLAASFLSYSLTQKAEAAEMRSHARPLGHIETSILLGSVNVLFLGFIAIQLTYLFGGESNIVAQGLTYAEYARRGFFELVAVAVISYLVLVVTEMFTAKDTEKHSHAFRILSSAVILQVGVIMISAFCRMWLYEEAFGFTTLRLYTHAFVVLLGFVFAFLMYKILVEHRDNTFAFRTFLVVVVFVAAMNFFNPDAFIAQKNLERFAVTGDLDAAYLSALSSDATPVLLPALAMTTGKTQHELGHEFYTRLHREKTQYWMQWNLSRADEYELLAQNSAQLGKYAANADLVYPADTDSPVDTVQNNSI